MSNRSSSLESIFHSVLAHHPESNLDLLEQAYHFACQVHEGQFRSSGDPYIVHPTEVAQILAYLRLDIPSIIAGLLHDTVENTPTTLEEIETLFGQEIVQLVDGVTKLSKIGFKSSEEKQAENFRKIILAMSKDIRVILVKLADRLNNMRTLQYLPEHKQKMIAQETLDIYAPIANRLGLGSVKTELEDLCFHYLHPEAHLELKQKMQETEKKREEFLEEIVSILDPKLKEYGIHSQISGTTKNDYAIFEKIKRFSTEGEKIYEMTSFRILVDNITECYKTLGVIHATYKPVPGKFKDYIAMPKTNAYQALHTVVIGSLGEKIEIQILTYEMHEIAEIGILTEWKHKEKIDLRLRKSEEWIHRLLEWQKDLSDPNEFLETIKIDLFNEDVFAFTPRGELKQFAHGATPIDFAYAIHTSLGHQCVGAKVNGKMVPLKHRLKSGDTVEILTSTSQTPSEEWLHIARSSRAKTKIRSYMKEQRKEQPVSMPPLSGENYRIRLNFNHKPGVLLFILQKLEAYSIAIEAMRMSTRQPQEAILLLDLHMMEKNQLEKCLTALHSEGVTLQLKKAEF